MKRILLIFGGRSDEHEVSLHSAEAVLSHVDAARYKPLMVGITKGGRWLFYTGEVARIGDGTWQQDKMACVPCTPLMDGEAPALLLLDGTERRVYFEAAFPILHGKNGEDGSVQGLLALMGVPVIGCGLLAGALCMDKSRAHKLVAQAGIRVPREYTFGKGAAMAEMTAAADDIGYPLFVKPVRAGSSFGISKVTTPDALAKAIKTAFRYDETVILEEAIAGFEVGCAVMGTDTLQVGRVDEIELSQGFFDYEEKYTLKTSKIHCPARIGVAQEMAVQETAKHIYRVLDCRVFARVDLFLTHEGELVFNEVNTIPGFTDHSRYPNMMKAAGVPFDALITHLIEEGMKG